MNRPPRVSPSFLCLVACALGVVAILVLRRIRLDPVPLGSLLLCSPFSMFFLFQILYKKVTTPSGSPADISSSKLFFIGFWCVFLIRQLFVRDALMPTNGLVREDGTIGGGPLGNPDLTAIAVGIIGGFTMAIVGKAVASGRALAKGEALALSLKIYASSMIVWLGAGMFYRLSIALGIIEQQAVLFSRSIFWFVFNDSVGYLFLVPLIAAAYSFTLLHSARWAHTISNQDFTSAGLANESGLMNRHIETQ